MATYRFDPSANSIRLQGLVYGDQIQSLDLILDTGSVTTSIPLWVGDVLGLDPQRSPRELTLVEFSGVQSAPIVTLPRLRALEQNVDNLDAVCLDLPAQTQAEGVLGFNFLCRFTLVINFPKGILVIQPPTRNPFRRLANAWEILRATLFA